MFGGSEARPTWKNTPMNVQKKKIAGDDVNKDKTMVKGRDTQNTVQRGSLAAHLAGLNVNDIGNSASKEMLSMPCFFELS
jgi:hypothetical protein